MLSILIKRAKNQGQVGGVVPHLIDDGLSILQYADDTIIFMEHDLEKARNMKLLFCAFKQVSGLKINFHKSELFCFGEARGSLGTYMELFGCKQGDFPMKYLGIPIQYKKLRNSDWRVIEERVEKRLSSWKGKHLSIGGRLTLINSVLSSLPMYMMSFFAMFLKIWTIFALASTGKGMRVEKNIALLDGVPFANLRNKGVLGYMI